MATWDWQALKRHIDRKCDERGGEFLTRDGTPNYTALGPMIGMSEPLVWGWIGEQRHSRPSWRAMRALAALFDEPAALWLELAGYDPQGPPPSVEAFRRDVLRAVEKYAGDDASRTRLLRELEALARET